MPECPDEAGLSDRDAAFAHAIDHAATSRLLTLEFLLNLSLSTPLHKLESKLAGVLLGGAAQILLLDRVPPHAAINTAVQWAKDTIRAGAGAMVNAVLRKVSGLVHDQAGARQKRDHWADGRDELLLPDGSALVLNAPVLPLDDLERLAVVSSHPRPLLDRWAAAYGAEKSRRIALHGLAEAPTILNAVHASEPPVGAGLKFESHDRPGFHVCRGGREALTRFLDQRRDVWVQDPASAHPCTLAMSGLSARSQPARAIVDLCAGRGTKTRQLAAMFPEAEIVATDTDSARLADLRRAFQGVPRVKAVEMSQAMTGVAGADLVLLDVPCSNTGVLARRIEARYRPMEPQLLRLTAIQRSILESGARLLAPGGALLYSTCSLEPEENEQQVGLAAARLGLRLIREERVEPAGGPGERPARYQDASYAALLVRPVP